jgi:hypothetical protein
MAAVSSFGLQLCLLFLSSSAFVNVSGKSVCTEEELNEAQRAFRNCVESAKAGIVSAHANEEDGDLVCRSLEDMLAGCEPQVQRDKILNQRVFYMCIGSILGESRG